MSSVIFKCESCSATMTAPDNRVGEAIYCGECKERNVIEKGPLEFDCPHCSHPLHVSDRFVGQAIDCPQCHNAIDLEGDEDEECAEEDEQAFRFSCPFCSCDISAPVRSVGEISNCPDCGKSVQVPAVPKKSKPKLSLKAPIARVAPHPRSKQRGNQPSGDLDFCPRCGKGNPPGCVLCSDCGIRLPTGVRQTSWPEAGGGKRGRGSTGRNSKGTGQLILEDTAGCFLSLVKVLATAAAILFVVAAIVAHIEGDSNGTGRDASLGEHSGRNKASQSQVRVGDIEVTCPHCDVVIGRDTTCGNCRAMHVFWRERGDVAGNPECKRCGHMIRNDYLCRTCDTVIYANNLKYVQIAHP